MKHLSYLWLFSRPHALAGTCLQAIVIFALAKNITEPINLTLSLVAFTAIFFLHIYGMGINQIYDLPIDKVNKPFLPLASGHLTLKQGKVITYGAGLACLLLSTYDTTFLLPTIALLVFFTSAYSIPPLRFKEHAILSALSISLSRSFIYIGGFLLTLTNGHFFSEPHPLALLFIGYHFLYSLVISITKDIPDIKGDRKYNVQSFAVRWGTAKVLRLGLQILILLYIILLMNPFAFNLGEHSTLFSIAQFLQIIFLVFNYFRYAKKQKDDTKYYSLLWKTLYFQYLVFFSVSL